MRELRSLIWKEVKELSRNPKNLLSVVVVGLVFLPILGLIIKTSMMNTTGSSMMNIRICIMDLDHGDFSSVVKDVVLKKLNLDFIEYDVTESIIDIIDNKDLDILIIIPNKFTENITKGIKSPLYIYTRIREPSLSELNKVSLVNRIVEEAKRSLTRLLLRKIASHDRPEVILNPITSFKWTYFKGTIIRTSPQAIMQNFISQLVMLPMGILFTTLIAIQIASTSIALERESKTLEILLSLPVNRIYILLSKLIGSILVALVGALSLTVGFIIYTYEILSSTETFRIPQEPHNVELNVTLISSSLSPLNCILLAVVVFLTLILALTMAICLGAFAENVRSAISITGILVPFILFPLLISIFINPKTLSLPLRIALYAIPFTHTILAIKASLVSDYTTISIAIAYMSIFIVIAFYLTARFFATENILILRMKSLRVLPWRLRTRRTHHL